ncbi:rho GDP dissociation inhibitor [Coemansia sp. RSA 1822]|nr:rho GDP dissociation inhibitor [Coemansia sp. RSA 638]KAJ2122547.1 rho GDP dissociation inhibitor [Coemansia sp. RSA 720]KAJ2478216.1 rho GDP dissociation inhibitor [Coemansia sp. RSA 2131]KAJ2543017.1 rho GDP dissociation inhibitor [Coemansia sp. RSA 1853]KAJ2564659.1 rho GDP dissociation inhibitor [Coemansia sp. RSA 1822]KAJ2662189.1 rho GDP dissociation inhibitor [Coemansia sp. RSA 1199]
MSSQENDDLAPTSTAGFKVGEKKNIDELAQLDATDASLNKWKESLGLSHAQERFPDDPRTVVVQALVFQSEDRAIRMDVSTPKAVEELQKTPITIKEGCEYTFKIEFVVQREMVSGLKFLQQVKRKGIPVDKMEEMCGSYGPKYESQERTFPSSKAPSGMLARGTYNVKSRFIDDDNTVYLEWAWSMEIKKEWE